MDETASISLGSSSFGCCHRYRECSDAKRCLLQDEDNERAKLCSYRINLEQGNIFYGKNANDFFQDEFLAFCKLYYGTQGSLRSAIDDIIIYFASNSYLSGSAIWYHSLQIDELQKLGFVTYTRNHRRTLEKYSMQELKSATSTTLRKKDEIISYIISEKPDVLAQLSEPYCYIQIPKQNRKYILELYYDYFYATQNNRFLGSLPFAKKELEYVIDER